MIERPRVLDGERIAEVLICKVYIIDDVRHHHFNMEAEILSSTTGPNFKAINSIHWARETIKYVYGGSVGLHIGDFLNGPSKERVEVMRTRATI